MIIRFRNLIILGLLLTLPVQCSSPGSRIRKKELIPEQELIPLLVDIHLGNAFFSLSSLRNKYPGRDSISNYVDIISSYGYSLENFEKTISYYENHLDDFERIYGEVNKRLQEIERDFRGGENPLRDAHGGGGNLWKGKSEWHLPREGRRNKILVEVPAEKPGMYTLSVRIRVFHDDGSVNPKISLFFWYDDQSPKGKWIPVAEKPVPKDNQVHYYILSGTRKSNRITHLKAYLLDHENTDTVFVKHADVLDLRIDLKPSQNIPK